LEIRSFESSSPTPDAAPVTIAPLIDMGRATLWNKNGKGSDALNKWDIKALKIDRVGTQCSANKQTSRGRSRSFIAWF